LPGPGRAFIARTASGPSMRYDRNLHGGDAPALHAGCRALRARGSSCPAGARTRASTDAHTTAGGIVPRALLIASSIAFLAMSSAAAAGEAYPSRPIRLVNPYSPGGSVDVVCRTLAHFLSKAWGQRVVVDNRPGAGTNIGTEIVARAQPDGYTFLCNTTTVATTASFHPDLAFEPVQALRAVALVAQTPMMLVVHPGVAASSVRELIELARAKPGEFNFASAGTGATTHLALELFNHLARVNITHIAYKGGSMVLTALLGGQVSGAFNTPSTLLPHVRSGKLRALAMGSRQRSEFAPDLPTLAESGVPDYESVVWYAVLAPRKLQDGLAQRWNAHINAALEDPEVSATYRAAGMSPLGG